MSAYACYPNRGSEPGTGWHFAREAARHCDTWVICHEEECREPIEAFVAEHGEIDGLRFVFVPLGKRLAPFTRIPGMFYVGYRSWHRSVLRTARKLHEHIGFDVVHQLTLCTYREPGHLWRLGLPFIWGPFAGTHNFPWRFLAQAGWRTACSEGLRSLVNGFQLRWSRHVRRGLIKASYLLASNSEVQRDIARVHGVATERMCDVGVETLAPAAERRRAARCGRLRVLWAGGFVAGKALNLLLESLCLLPPETECEVRIAGQGRMGRRWRRMARDLGVDRLITWTGQLTQSETINEMRRADVLVFTSLRDAVGTVLVEALSVGCPVVCLAHQGADDVVNSECGVKLPVTSPRDVARSLADALARLAADPDWRRELSRGALRRAEGFLWGRYGDRMGTLDLSLARGRALQPITGGDERPADCGGE
jgi:glycosyltransferase involved in cell wall biosynthesis